MLVPPLGRPTPLSSDDIRDLLRRGDTAVAEALAAMSARVVELERQRAKHSGNSGKPPSSDGLHRPRRRYLPRARSGRKPGGQAGHPGHTLPMREQPDHLVLHVVGKDCDCGYGLAEVPVTFEKRQVFDLPPMKLEVTEHPELLT